MELQLINLKTYLEKVETELVPKIPEETRNGYEDFLTEVLTFAVVLYTKLEALLKSEIDDTEYDLWIETQKLKTRNDWLNVIQIGTQSTDISTSLAQLAQGMELTLKVTGRNWTGNRRD